MSYRIAIAASGPYAGKSTLAATIQTLLIQSPKDKCYRIGFTKPIVDFCKHYLGKSDRITLQKFGAKVREIDEDVWVRWLDRYRMKNIDPLWPVVCDQLRFPNELEYFKKNGWLTVYLSVSLPNRELRKAKRIGGSGKLTDNELNHECETALKGYVDQFDLVLDGNDDTPEQLAKLVLAKCETFFKKEVV